MKLLRKASLRRPRGGQISFSGLCSLCAVVAVVVVVSVPRLGRIARAENDSDARSTARFLADSLQQLTAESPTEGAPDPGRFLTHPRLLRTLTDATPAAGARPALAYHGYRFEVVPMPPEWALLEASGPWPKRAGPVPPWAVRARPLRPGATGGRAYLAFPGGRTYACREASPAASLSAWRLVD